MIQVQKIYKWLLIAPAILPLIYVDGMLYPYLTPKTFLLRALGVAAFALFVYLQATGAPAYWQRLRSWVSWVPAALLLVAYFTSLVGIDFYTSFWSSYERGDGLLTLTVIVGFFYFILLTAEKDFSPLLYTVVAWVGSLVALQAILQWLAGAAGLDIPLISLSGNRVGGTLGNAAFLASYLSLSLFVTLFVADISQKRTKIVLYIGAALQLLAVVLTATRGSILALGLVGIAALVYFSARGSAAHKKYARGGLIALVVFALLFVIFRSSLSHSPITPVARVASISFTDPTVSSRLFLWKNLTEAALPHALVGVGAEHIAVLFDKVYDPSQIQEQWFDRSHNAFLDYFIQFGVAGFLLYCALVIGAAYVGWRTYAAESKQGLMLLVVTFVYAVQNFFVFDTAVVLWLFIVLLASVLARQYHATASRLITIPAGAWVGGVVGVALLSLLIPVCIWPLRANLYLADAYHYHVADVNLSVEAMQKGLALGTYAQLEYGYEAYQMYTGEQLTQLTGADLVTAYKNTEHVLENNFFAYPYDARTAVYFAHVLDSVPQGASSSPALFEQALARSIDLSPKRSQPWYLKANVYIEQGDAAKTTKDKIAAYTQAIEVLKQYVSAVPMLAEPRYVIASLYLTLGDAASAKEWAAQAYARHTQNTDEASRAVKYYIAVQDWPHTAEFLQYIVNENSTDYDSWYDLAKASYLAGDIEKAKAIVAQLRKEKPGLVETDPAFLKALGQ